MSTTTAKAPQAPTVALGAAACDEKVTRSQRVYRDVPNVERVALADGRTGAIQREKRADGTDGPMAVAIITRAKDGQENAQRFPLADLQRVSDALAQKGIVLIGAPSGK